MGPYYPQNSITTPDIELDIVEGKVFFKFFPCIFAFKHFDCNNWTVCDKSWQSMIHLAPPGPQYKPRLRPQPNLTNSHASLGGGARPRPRPRTLEVARKMDEGECLELFACKGHESWSHSWKVMSSFA